MAYSKAAKNFH